PSTASPSGRSFNGRGPNRKPHLWWGAQQRECVAEVSDMTAVITDEKIPNNVNLAGDKRLQRALEAWQPHFIDWWKQMGPVGWQERDVYLRPRCRSRPTAGRTSTTSR